MRTASPGGDPVRELSMKRAGLAAIVLLVPGLLLAQPDGRSEAGPSFHGPSDGAWLFGGSFGFGFGDVIFVAVSPTATYVVSPRVHVGADLTFRYTDDRRYSPSTSSTDYGAGAFVRAFVIDRVFAEVAYEYLSYEPYVRSGGQTRQGASSLLVGGGYAQPLGGRTALTLEALYNLTFDSSGPYARPLTLRFGVVTSF